MMPSTRPSNLPDFASVRAELVEVARPIQTERI